MNPQTFQMLYDYNYSARDKVWGCVTALSDAQYTQPLDYSVGSIHEQVVHMMAAEHIWFSRLTGTSPDRLWNGADFPDRDAVWEKWQQVEQTVRSYIGALTDEQLKLECHYNKTSGAPDSAPIAGILLHVVNHATDHRAQTLAMIHTLGAETLPQDLIYYLRDL